MSEAPLRVGLVGLGRMGRNHLRVLSMLNSVSLRFAYDQDAAAMRRACAAHGLQPCGDLDAALKDVDALVIATPTSTHAAYIERAARHVGRMFVEKPLVGTLAEAEALRKSIGGLRIQVGFIERFNPAVRQLKRILDQSPQVVNVDFTRTNRVSARITDVDVITDLMIHDIDLALHLNGPVKAVHAHGLRAQGMVDFASAVLEHANGRLSRVLASRITEKKIRSIQATCTDMFVDCDLLRKEILINRQSELKSAPGEPYVISAVEQAVEVLPTEALVAELQAFVAFCRGGGDVPTAEDGIQALAVCDAVQKAIPK